MATNSTEQLEFDFMKKGMNMPSVNLSFNVPEDDKHLHNVLYGGMYREAMNELDQYIETLITSHEAKPYDVTLADLVSVRTKLLNVLEARNIDL